ncbi:MAG: hypothetical protein ACR2JB_29795 [Bryobacteraceae bacterium]
MSSRRTSSMRMTRRQWTAFISATPLLGQVTSKPPQGAPAPAPASATPEETLKKAYADVREVSDRLSHIEVPMNVEPAFAFKV